MPDENLTKFAGAAAADPSLQKKIQAIHAGAARIAAERVAELAAESGFSLTAEELLAGPSRITGELGEEDLQAVAGGTWDSNGVNIAVSVISFGILCAGLATMSAARGDVDACQARR